MTTVVQARSVSKKFTRSLRRSMTYGICDIARDLAGAGSRGGRLRTGEFWAVDDVSFEVRRGETLGLVGSNGSGKSTLLKMLNGIYRPDRGRIEIAGKVGALIEVAAGFHPMLTGRENIYVNGAILGMSKREVDRKFDAIVEFADIGDFLDSPVRYYSSGMYVRLGFAVAAHSEPDVLLVDEVLAVGDARFQNKCHDRILRLKQEAGVILVTHNLASVSMLCDRVLWVDKGVPRVAGTASQVIAQYADAMMAGTLADQMANDPNVTVTHEMTLGKVQVLDEHGEPVKRLPSGRPFSIRCEYEAHQDLGEPYFQIAVLSARGLAVFGASMVADGRPRAKIGIGSGQIEAAFDDLPLQPGLYAVNVSVRPQSSIGKLARRLYAAMIEVEDAGDGADVGPLAVYNQRFLGSVRVPYRWRHESPREAAMARDA